MQGGLQARWGVQLRAQPRPAAAEAGPVPHSVLQGVLQEGRVRERPGLGAGQARGGGGGWPPMDGRPGGGAGAPSAAGPQSHGRGRPGRAGPPAPLEAEETPIFGAKTDHHSRLFQRTASKDAESDGGSTEARSEGSGGVSSSEEARAEAGTGDEDEGVAETLDRAGRVASVSRYAQYGWVVSVKNSFLHFETQDSSSAGKRHRDKFWTL
eukprot:CAMPEP_0179206112 /NCGR_PEP_ID=MMETSP0796-20121207/102766_1 /TAXON_ID=73915 /ORGANISM="Pyrodinium bahamense, Strain pbaha01" /LENGTH=209 /DNA_ID=CAMNT_0020911021 /DNA_START=65 /DNA_END=693 /DNA_ORIENTATION=-